MKPFNLERALAGDPVVTRSGKKVIAIYPIKEFSDVKDRMDLFVVIEDKNNSGDWGWSHKNGCQRKDGQGEYGFDLFMATKIKTYYQNIYRNCGNGQINACGSSYNSEKEAMENAPLNDEYWEYIKTITFEIEE